MADRLAELQAELQSRQAPPPQPERIAELQAEVEKRQAEGVQSPVLEPALTILSAIPAEVAAGGRAIYETMTGSPDVRAAVEETREAFTYQPRTKAGQESLQKFGEFMQPVGEAFEATEEFLGEGTYELTGSPVLAAGAESLPTLALELLGLEGARVTSKNAPKAAKRVARMTDDLYAGVDNAVKTILGDPKVRVYDDAGEFTQDAIDALKKKAEEGVDVDLEISGQLQKTGVVTPEQAERFNLFKRRGIDATRANITQATDDWLRQQDLMKESGDVSGLVANQDARLSDLAREGKESIGAIADDVASTNAGLQSVVNDIAETADNAVSEAYRAAREAAPGEMNIKLGGLVEGLRKSAPENTASGGTVKQIKGILQEKGIIPAKGWKAEGKIDVETAESIRQELNKIWGEASDGSRQSATTRRIISDLKDALDEDVAGAVGEDLFFDARQQKRRFHELIERRKGGKFDKYTGNLLEDILYNKVPQEQIVNKIIKTNRPEEFAHLKDFFLNKSGDAGISAWNNLKANIFDEAIEKARGAKTEGGVDSFVGSRFEKVFAPLKNTKAGKGKDAPTRYEALFTPEERSLIDDIIEISKARTPVKSVYAGSGPSGFAVNRAVESLIDRMSPKMLRNSIEKRRLRRKEQEALAVPQRELEKAVKQ